MEKLTRYTLVALTAGLCIASAYARYHNGYDRDGYVYEEGRGGGRSVGKGIFAGAATGAVVGGAAGGGRGAGYGALGGAVLGGLIGGSRRKTRVYHPDEVRAIERENDALKSEYENLMRQARQLESVVAARRPFNSRYSSSKYADGTVRSLKKENKALRKENSRLRKHISKLERQQANQPQQQRKNNVRNAY